MFERKPNEAEKKLFLNLMFPKIKRSLTEDIRGRVLYSLKKGKITDALLEDAFPDAWRGMKELTAQKPRIGLFDKRNYVYDYFFKVYNHRSQNKVLPAQVLACKAERRHGKNLMNVKIRYYDGRLEDTSLEVFPEIELRVDFNDYVLVHHKTICHKLLPAEYKKIMDDYFSVQ